MTDRLYGLSGATMLTPQEMLPGMSLTISGRHISSLEQPTAGPVLDLRGHLVFPGLINAHDHLFGNWWPRVAPGRPYANVYQWLDEYEKSARLYERGQNSPQDMYTLGMYRNLICGVTTVADHYMRIANPEFYTRHPIHILHDYGRSWLPRTQRRCGWGEDIQTEYGRAVRNSRPYVIHLSEGVDEQASTEMNVLLEENALGRNTMVIHGIALRHSDMRAMADVGASLCWCPFSNLYLYGQTADIPALIEAGVNITLGTDSTMTGSLNLLEEMRTARDTFRAQTGQDPSPRWLVELVTTHAAYALMLEDRRGKIAPGYEADLLVLPDMQRDPYSTLVDAQIDDISLLICGGIPVYGDPCYRPFFEQFSPQFTSVLVSQTPAESASQGYVEPDSRTEKLIAGDLLGLLERISNAIGYAVQLPFLPCTAPPQENGGS